MLEGPQDFDEWLEAGDWTLLTSQRAALDETPLTEREQQLLKEADRRIRAKISREQCEEMANFEPDLQIMAWWGRPESDTP